MSQYRQWLDLTPITNMHVTQAFLNNVPSIQAFLNSVPSIVMSNMLWYEIVLLVLFSTGITALLYIYLIRKSEKDRKIHKPGFRSNQSKSTSFTGMLALASYASLWVYIVYRLLSVTTVESIMDSVSSDVVIYGMMNIIITYLIIITTMIFSRWILVFIVYGVMVSPPAIGFYIMLLYPSPIAIALFVGTVLVTLILHNFLFEYIRDAVSVFTYSASAVLENFTPIFSMIFITTTIFSMQVFVLYTFARSFSSFSFQDGILLIFALDWSITLYRYINKAFMASTVYLGMEKDNKRNIFRQSFLATMSSFGAICSAAFVPSALRSVRIVIEKLYIMSTKSSKPWVIYLVRPVLYLLRTLIATLLYVFSFFNESIIPYIGIYGGEYDRSTAEKAVHVLSRSPVYQFLNMPYIKTYVSACITAIPSMIVLFVGNWMIAPSMDISTILENLDIYDLSSSMSAITSTAAIFMFCIAIIYTFVSSIDAAIAAKICHDYDTKRIDNGEKQSIQTDDIEE